MPVQTGNHGDTLIANFQMRKLRGTAIRTLIALLALGIAGTAGGALFVYFGVYNVAATEQHTGPVYWLLDVAMRRSVQRRAEHIQVPALDERATIERGFRLFEANCEICHGGPGVAPGAIALGLTPLPANLAHAALQLKPAELFWVIKHGIKMAGMPAWEFRLPEQDLWAIVAFVEELPKLTPLQYKEIARTLREVDAETVPPLPDPTPGRGDVERGETAFYQYACVTCHEIPGVTGADKPVGPPLDKIATRVFIAGTLPNTPENMVRWLRAPLEVNPRTAMPDLRVTERDAWDIAAYLYTLK